jgi:hypothetical protein
MRISRKLMLIAVPVVLLAATASAIAVSAKAPGQQATTAPAAVTSPATPTKPEVETPEASPESSTESTQDAKNEPAGGGHTDEAPGATTESNVDHQFEGQE